MNPGRSKPVCLAALILGLLSLAAPTRAGDGYGPGGDIRFAAESEAAAWVGQEIELYLELWSDGFSFGDQSFLLPEVRGAYLLQADSSTVKLNENRDGVAWQGLRYTFLLYPQRAGRLQVPPFEVRFSARAAYGSDPAAFEFRTPPVFIDARIPPGADSGALVVTTTSFTMEASWTPGVPEDGPAVLKVGDAVTLEVSRRARDVPGMVFAPLPELSIDGLGVYPDSPRVNDQTNRGSLTGARSDSVTFICEREGRFEIPKLRFQWWDPEREILSEKIVPALELEVTANPAYASAAAGRSTGGGKSIDWKTGAALLLGIALLMFPGRWLGRLIAEWSRQRRAERRAGEPWAFRQVRRACVSGTAPEAYNAITLWLSRIDRGGPGMTLTRWAAESGDHALLLESIALQENVAGGSKGEWNGRELAQLLARTRSRPDGPLKDANVLDPLNP